MYRNSWFGFIIFGLVVIAGCGDDETGPSFPNAPEARSENDNSSKGIYKGVLIGSSGYVKVNIDNNGDGEISMTLNIDNATYQLTTEQRYNSSIGGFQGYFRGNVHGGQASIGFYVLNNGQEYGFFEVDIPGHPNVCFQVVKEKSNALVRCFAGTFSGSESGIINFVLIDDEWCAVARENDESGCSELEGALNGSTLVCNCDFDGNGDNDVDFTGTINGNALSGTWSAGDSSGTWNATRIF